MVNSVSSHLPLSGAGSINAAAKPPAPNSNDDAEVRRAFSAFVGQTFYGQMLQAMRKTLGKPAYFYGGKTEEIFRAQLDQVIGEKLAAADGEKLSGAMYELYKLQRG